MSKANAMSPTPFLSPPMHRSGSRPSCQLLRHSFWRALRRFGFRPGSRSLAPASCCSLLRIAVASYSVAVRGTHGSKGEVLSICYGLLLSAPCSLYSICQHAAPCKCKPVTQPPIDSCSTALDCLSLANQRRNPACSVCVSDVFLVIYYYVLLVRCYSSSSGPGRTEFPLNADNTATRIIPEKGKLTS